MKLSTRTQYGLRMLCQLALEYPNGPIQLNEIGLREGISEKYLAQIMLILRASGLVSSVRGSQGGYFLSRTPDRIGMLEVFEVLEGEVLEFGEPSENEETKNPPDATGALPVRGNTVASMNAVWLRLRKAVEESLRGYTLDDVAKLGIYQTGYMDYKI